MPAVYLWCSIIASVMLIKRNTGGAYCCWGAGVLVLVAGAKENIRWAAGNKCSSQNEHNNNKNTFGRGGRIALIVTLAPTEESLSRVESTNPSSKV